VNARRLLTSGAVRSLGRRRTRKSDDGREHQERIPTMLRAMERENFHVIVFPLRSAVDESIICSGVSPKRCIIKRTSAASIARPFPMNSPANEAY